jgi:AcrR family transcriptional regulator
MRSDAVRNRQSILTGAIGVLVEAPGASMREIAEASGTGRTTLYRHFPDREALVAAIYERVYDEARARTSVALDRPGADEDPVATLASLCLALAGLGDEYRFLEHFPKAGPPERPSDEPLRAFLRAGQRAGRIRDDLQADWLFDVLVALITAAAAPRRSRDGLRATVVSVLSPTP